MKKLLLYTLPLLMVMLLAACSKDGKEPVKPPQPEEKTRMENATFTFSVNLPAQANPSSKNNSDSNSIETYAMSTQDENEVIEINVLAFLDNAGTFELADRAEATNIENVASGTDGNKKKFKVKFSKLIKNSQYQFVVIANAKSEVAKLFAAHGITDGAQKSTTLALLKLEGIEKWVNPAGAIIRNLPMWGESETETVSENMDISNVRLLRMVAKINVTIDATTGVRDKFKLEIVDLYNFNKDGRVSPDVGNLASGSKSKVVKPTDTGIHTQGPISYTSSSYEALTETIYTFESKVPYLVAPNVDLGEVICLVIGGRYDGSATTRYYRADIAKKNVITDSYDYMDILRNYNYKVNVTKIANNGYDSSWEAFNSRAVNIDVDIEAWDEDDVVVDYDGQYQFGTDKRHLDFFMEGRAQDILVFADHPSGWSVDMATKPGWITITPTGDNSGTPKLMSVSVDPILATDADRSGEFYIVAGNLRKKITVKQTALAEFSLEVAPIDIIFRKSAASAKSFSVKSFPAGLTHTITYPTGGTNIVWETGYEPPASGSLSSYTIKPAPITIGGERATTITISVTHPISNVTISKTVSVTQYASDIEFVVTKQASYPAEGGDVEFDVRSAAMWQLNTTSPFVSNYANGPQPISLTNVPYPFTLEGNKTYQNRTITFEATAGDSETPDFPIQNVDIVQLHKPPYLTPLDGITVDFGSATATKTIRFKSNAKWAITAGGSNVADVLINYPTTDNGSSANALSENQSSVTLTPAATYIARLGAAGSDVTSSITISTKDHTPALLAQAVVTVKRKVPAVWAYASISPVSGTALAHAGQNVTVYANTNAAWQVGSNVATTVSATASAYAANRSQAIAIPKNATWNSRTVTVSAIQTGGALANRGSYPQPGYTFAYSSDIPTSIPAAGGTNNIYCKTTTSAPIVNIRAVVGTIAVSAEVAVPAIIAGTPQFKAVAVQANGAAVHNGSVNRTVTYQWKHPVTGAWAALGSTTQYGYNLSYASGAPASLPAVASTQTLKFNSTGNVPAGYSVRARNTTTGAISSAPIPASLAPGTVSAAVSIPANPVWGTTSNATIAIEWGTGSTWNPIKTYTQVGWDLTAGFKSQNVGHGGGTIPVTMTSVNGSPQMNVYYIVKIGSNWSSYKNVGIIPALPAGGSYTYDCVVGVISSGQSTVEHQFVFELISGRYVKMAHIYQNAT